MSNQPQYSALYRVIEAEVVPTCRELGISQVVFSPIAQGVLTGKYQPGAAGTGRLAGHRPGRLGVHQEPADRRHPDPGRSSWQPLADAEGLTMAQLAVAWVLQNDNVATAITGGSRPEQITDNAAAAGKKLSAETMAGIDAALGDVVQAGRLAGRQGLAAQRA